MTTAAERWTKLEGERAEYLHRAIDCSALTIPSLVPESVEGDSHGHGTTAVLESLFQSVGSRGVSGLASKLLLALLPPNEPFFRFAIDDGEIQRRMGEAQNQGEAQRIITELDQQLSQMERQVLQRLDKMRVRPAAFEAMKHLVVSGNALLYLGQEAVQVHPLYSYVIDRDTEGNPVELILKQQVSNRFLQSGEAANSEENEDKILYTRVNWYYKRDRVEWHQESDGEKLRGRSGFSTLYASPWLPLRLVRCAGESYGRGLVEEVLGDLNSMNELMRALVEGNLQMSKVVWLCNPNGMTNPDDLARAENGDVVAGLVEDVQALTTDKARDFASALQMSSVIERRLNYHFLMNESVQRDAERVTAEEIRLMAQMLDQGLGGHYSMLSEEFQLPLIRRVSSIMQAEGKLQQLPPDIIEPQITTGLEAIGRGNDKQRLQEFLGTVFQALGPEMAMQYINPTELISRLAASDGIDSQNLVKSEQEIQMERQRQQQAIMAQQAIGGIASNGGLPTGQAPSASTAG